MNWNPYFWKMDIPAEPRVAGSHYTYTKPGRFPITIPKKRPYVKEIYVKIVLRQMEDEK